MEDHSKDYTPSVIEQLKFYLIYISFMMILITYLPITGVVVAFVLPLPSIICTLFIKSRYYVIYALTSLIISIIFCIGDFTSVLFTLIPVLISSFVYAFLIKCNLIVKLVNKFWAKM